MPEAEIVKVCIAQFLLTNRFHNQDVAVVLDNVFSGLWIWNELEKVHVHFHRSELITCLGLTDDVLEFMENMEDVNTSWRFICPRRVRTG